jgi:SAM-dependent methyltransferase
MPPDSLLAGVGGGDYWYVGERALFLLKKLARLRSSDRVLDVGCGIGRLAWPLARKLNRSGSYDGLDVVQAYTDWCVTSLGLDPVRFRFHHADIRNSSYNPNGTIEAKDFVFPWAEDSFSLTIATSLFTHLLPDVTVHYVREIARTLRRGGRLFASLFLLDASSREVVAAGITNPTFGFPMEHGLLHDPAVPESAVAYDAEWIFETLAATGLSVTAVHPGHWKGQPGLEYQDLVVAVRMR